MSPEQLEEIINTTPDPHRRAAAYAALSLTRVLAPEWTHVVTLKEKGKEPKHMTMMKTAGQMFGDREGVQKRLDALLEELRPG